MILQAGIEYVLYDKKFSEKLKSTINKDQTLLLLKEKLQELFEEEASVSKASVSNSTIKILKQAAPVLYTSPNTTTHETISTNQRDTSSIQHHTEEKPVKDNTKNKWFEFFKTDVSKKKIAKTVITHVEKTRPERELKEQQVENKSENMLWIVLYGLLIGLILILLVYKFVIMK